MIISSPRVLVAAFSWLCDVMEITRSKRTNYARKGQLGALHGGVGNFETITHFFLLFTSLKMPRLVVSLTVTM